MMKLKYSLPILIAIMPGAEIPLFAQESPAHPGTRTEAPQQRRPNVLIWLMDDVGFGQLSSYGGLVQTPNIDRIAAMGLRYGNYHTAPVCSASRASLLTGRMAHSVHMGGHAALPAKGDGYDGLVPPSAGTIAENLRQAGYTTFAVGKWDHLPTTHVSPAGPFAYWPLGQGFNRFYGFLAPDTDQWHPNVVRDNGATVTPEAVGSHFSADMADEAIDMIRSRDGAAARSPFLMYWASGAAHAPHHAPREWLERYRGKFDMGWDKAREIVLRRQIAYGLVPRGTRLAQRPPGMPAWNALSHEQKSLYARQMEAFAASLSYADAQFGRILDELQARGELSDTMIVITSDNGPSAEGGPSGLPNETYRSSRTTLTLAENMRSYDAWGGPNTYPNYHFGWAVAGSTPYRYYKQTTYEGGQRVPLIVAWSNGIAERGQWRQQFVHVSDIAPTVLDTIGLAPAATVNNVRQSPMEGISFRPSYGTVGDPRQGRAQYAEMFGNRGLNWKGWSIVTNHRSETWKFAVGPGFDEPWELYDLVNDPGQTVDLAARYPEKVEEMSKLFEDQARRYNVYPLHNAIDGLPAIVELARSSFAARGGVWRFSGSVNGIPSLNAPPILERSFTMTVRLDLPRDDVTGPIFAFGSTLGGIGLYLENGKPVFVANEIDGDSARVSSDKALGLGGRELALSVAKGTPRASGPTDYDVTISIGGEIVAKQTIRAAVPRALNWSETFAVGRDDAAPILAGYPAGKPLGAKIEDMVIDFNR